MIPITPFRAREDATGIGGDFDRDTPFAVLSGDVITRRQFFEEALAEGLLEAPCRYLINLHESRYRFAVSLWGGWWMGRQILLPPDRSLYRLETLQTRYHDSWLVGLQEQESPLDYPPKQPNQTAGRIPSPDQNVLLAFTSGSTGEPTPHLKTFDMLSTSARLIDQFLGGTEGVSLVSTVPQQHMYGLELSVLLPLFCGATLHDMKPFYPADIVAALNSVQAPRALVTTPFHLRVLMDSGLSLPRVDFVVSATAPLDRNLAVHVEKAFKGPLHEIYGCTEAGSLAGRRPVDSPLWCWFEGIRPHQQAGFFSVEAPHLPIRVPLQDELTLSDSRQFTLEGRRSEVINIAGKRHSLSGLEHQLRAIKGVDDAAFLQIETADERPVERLVAFIVADEGLSNQLILESLRQRLDPVFVPRKLFRVPRIPRGATGKIPLEALKSLYENLSVGV